jgi:dihydrolipoamide dehydrogenase
MVNKKTIKAEVAVLGAGPGGYVAAIRLAQLGKKVVLVDRGNLGGICLNHGCIPSKAMIYASDFLDHIKKSDIMGIKANEVSLDFGKLQKWKDEIITKLNKGIEILCKSNKIEVIKGEAYIDKPKSIRIEEGGVTTYIEFENCIIATGSFPIEIPNMKFDGKQIISSREALKLKKVPNCLVVIGGGYIGLELGTVYAKLGSKVHIVEMMDQILPGSDIDIVDVIKRNLDTIGIEVHTNSKASTYKNGILKIETKDGKGIQIKTDKVLVAVGRSPATDNLGIENTKIKLDEKGFIQVDENLMTHEKGIYAIGDVSVGPMLAHKASKQGKIVAEIICGLNVSHEDLIVPAVIFTDPEIATVGMDEKESRGKGFNITVGKFPFRASSRAMTMNQNKGFVKIVAESKSKKILGVQIVASNASDLISEAALAVKMGANLEDLSTTIHPHPTMSESLMEAAEATLGKAIHIYNPK